MDSKLRLAWKKTYDEKLSKDKYTGNALLAAQKALSKIKKMREARLFNITLYRYKGDVKGIKVVPKNPKTPNLAGPKDGAREETDGTIIGLGHDGHCCGRGMYPASGLGYRNTLNPVNTTFIFQF